LKKSPEEVDQDPSSRIHRGSILFGEAENSRIRCVIRQTRSDKNSQSRSGNRHGSLLKNNQCFGQTEMSGPLSQSIASSGSTDVFVGVFFNRQIGQALPDKQMTSSLSLKVTASP